MRMLTTLPGSLTTVFGASLASPVFITVLVPLLISCFACLLIRKNADKLGLLDKPGARKIHTVPIPVGGGLGIWLGVCLPIACLSVVVLLLVRSTNGGEPNSSISTFIPQFVFDHLGGINLRLGRLWGLLALGSILTLLGTLDDRYNLSWKLRLGIEFIVAIIAVASGWRATFFVDVPFITYPVSVLWIVGLVNSFNMLDNMDGLSGGVAVICSVVLAAVALCFAPNPESGAPQYFLAFFLLLLAGSICGFLIHNRPPAKMFMGDGGAYFIGFLLATTTLSMTFVGPSAPKSAIFTPIVVLAVPIYDAVSVIIIRLHNRVSPFVGDKNHYSHRLVALGLTKVQAVATIYLTTTVCAIGAFFLYQVNFTCAVLILVQTFLILALVAILEFAGRKSVRAKADGSSELVGDKTDNSATFSDNQLDKRENARKINKTDKI